jgi:hypothetical protein
MTKQLIVNSLLGQVDNWDCELYTKHYIMLYIIYWVFII